MCEDPVGFFLYYSLLFWRNKYSLYLPFSLPGLNSQNQLLFKNLLKKKCEFYRRHILRLFRDRGFRIIKILHEEDTAMIWRILVKTKTNKAQNKCWCLKTLLSPFRTILYCFEETITFFLYRSLSKSLFLAQTLKTPVI